MGNEQGTKVIGEWKPTRCRGDGFYQYRIERQIGPCLRDDYEFLRDDQGEPMEFRSRHEANGYIARRLA